MQIAHAQKLLVCLRYGIGDFIMESSLLPDLRRAVDGGHITLLGASAVAGLLEGTAWADRVESYDALGMADWGGTCDEAVRERVGAWLDAEGFDASVNPTSAPRPLPDEVRLRGIPSFETERGAVRDALSRGASAAFAVRIASARGWDLPVVPGPGTSLPRDPDRSYAAEAMAELERGGVQPIGLLPFASSGLKRWPAERFGAVARRLAEMGAGPVVVLSSPHDDAAERVEAAAGNDAVRRLPPVSLPRVLGLIERCRLVLSNDTGLMHAAGVLRVPVVAVFGPTVGRIYHPGNPWDRVLQSSVACPHRKERRLGPPECVVHETCLLGLRSCIDAVAVPDVVAALEALPTFSVPLPARAGRA